MKDRLPFLTTSDSEAALLNLSAINHFRGQRECTKMVAPVALAEMVPDSPTEVYVNRLWTPHPNKTQVLEESTRKNNFHGFVLGTVGDTDDWSTGIILKTVEDGWGYKHFDISTIGLAIMTTTRVVGDWESDPQIYIMRVPTFADKERLAKPVLDLVSEVTELVMTGKTFRRLTKEIKNALIKNGDNDLYREMRQIFMDKDFDAESMVLNLTKTRYRLK